VPEAASEVYGKKIVERPLPQQPAPKLPFTPEDLRSALAQNPAPQAPPPIKQATMPVERDISHDIIEFESALRDAHETVQVPAPVRVPTIMPKTPPPMPQEAPFFDEFEQFLAREDLDAEGLVEKDILYRMKEFHKHRQSGKEYYLYSKDVQAAVNRKLGELKQLEREWFQEREQMDRLEKNIMIIEQEIEARTADLKGLLKQAKTKSRLERTVAAGQEFVLADGRKLSSLLDLKTALHTMPDTVFSHHVTSIKNDFASWVRGSLGDSDLANQMGPIRDKQQLELFLNKIT
jgi:hypothetical protein